MLDPDHAPSPSRSLGAHGLVLWRAIMDEYAIADPGGIEILLQCCEAADRIATMAARIQRDGEVVETRSGPKAHPLLSQEFAARGFLCRSLERLGINLEAVRSPGRPSGAAWKGRKEREDADH